ncbi:Disease resistance protein CC-NBS-LRR class family, partial [Prunus dulcis]
TRQNKTPDRNNKTRDGRRIRHARRRRRAHPSKTKEELPSRVELARILCQSDETMIREEENRGKKEENRVRVREKRKSGVYLRRNSVSISSLKFWMANLAKLEFAALDLSGDNYLSWVLDAKIHLRANGLGQTIVDENDASPEENAKAMIFLRRHIHEALKSEYVVVDEPLVLWKALGERYDHQRTVTLPRARYEWTHLRFQDFKSVSEYNSAMHRITSLMRLCGEKYI